MVEVPLIRGYQPLAELDRGFPAGHIDSRAIQQFPWRTVRFASIPKDISIIPDHPCDLLGQLLDGVILTDADINGQLNGFQTIA